MMKTAYIDFDGTIVDVMPRYHGILESYVRLRTKYKIDFFKYCYLKREGYKDHAIVSELCDGYQINIKDYLEYKRANLEDSYWLSKDKIIGSPKIAIDNLKMMGYKVVLLTQRNNKLNLFNQVKELGLEKQFDEIIVVKPLSNQNAKINYLNNITQPDDIIIGDSKIEIECANTLNIRGFFVESGLFNSKCIIQNVVSFRNFNEVVEYLYGQ